MRRLLLDQGLSPSAAALLRERGWDSLHVSEVALNRADDVSILEFARSDNRACVTLDHDFHAHLALLQSTRPSVVLIRLAGLKAVAQVALIEAVWEECQKDLDAGAAVSVFSSRIRVRRLPLG